MTRRPMLIAFAIFATFLCLSQAAEAQRLEMRSHVPISYLENVGFRPSDIPHTHLVFRASLLPECDPSQYEDYYKATQDRAVPNFFDLLDQEWRAYGRQHFGSLPSQGSWFTIITDDGDAAIGLGFRDGELIVEGVDLQFLLLREPEHFRVHPPDADVSNMKCAIDISVSPPSSG